MLLCDPRVSREWQPCNFALAKDAERSKSMKVMHTFCLLDELLHFRLSYI